MSLTKKQIEDYISSGGLICPFCESDEIMAVGSIDVGDTVGAQVVRCHGCKKEWNDIYKLINIVL